MFFAFEDAPYIAVIGDIVASKELHQRSAVQMRLNRALHHVNIRYREDMAANFVITLGDEFQGLLRSGDHLLDIIDSIEEELYPVRIRVGIGIGAIATEIEDAASPEIDGPAYHNARRMIDELKAAEKKNTEAKPDKKILVAEHPEVSALINSVLSLNGALKSRWTERQREIINVYRNRKTQSGAAKELGVNQSTVQKALIGADYYTYRNARETLTAIFAEIKETNHV